MIIICKYKTVVNHPLLSIKSSVQMIMQAFVCYPFFLNCHLRITVVLVLAILIIHVSLCCHLFCGTSGSTW